MSSTFKQVGSLVFNQQDGVVKHARTNEDLAKYLVKIAVPLIITDFIGDVAIDSTGVKAQTYAFKIPSEAFKHIRGMKFTSYTDDPTATDAVLRVELYNYTDGEVVAYNEYAREGGYKEADISESVAKALNGKLLGQRVNVTTASATSGATQKVRMVALWLIYDLTK